MRRALAAAFFLAFALFAACAIYGPGLLTAVDGGTDAPVVTDVADAGPACESAGWPGRPAKDDPATYNGAEFVLALETIRFDPDAGGGKLVGYDLDRTCTCPGKASCNPAADAAVKCDDPNGRDNSGGLLLASFSAFAGDIFDSSKLNQRIGDGRFTLLVRIKDYNGSANDTQVTTALFVSAGMKGVEDGGTPDKPKFDGTDEWTVDPGSLFGGTGPPFVPLPDAVDTNAYVKDGMIVAVVGEVKLTLAGNTGSVGIDVTGAVITGHLVPRMGTFEMPDGLLAARWPSRKLLVQLAGIKDPFVPNQYLCGDSGTYHQIKPLICNARDIVTAVQNDNTNAYCDALSIGFGFHATPAKMYQPFSKGPPLTPCGPQWDDDCLK